ncbi:uncharacterized protein KY384_007466 [Bacidia gigantensis]|uniref:uncharacterized protein n=1 Tax=Bacidia gigantensis TaxID=2732470 RepID=UPI001D046490|nr:uncharacterized protein KY384_007466 [Bacidia gigantensis]KAG8528548.1 hypothetical protein KY384_007466 [Bacidia gigantensis]
MSSIKQEVEEPLPWHLGVFDAHCHPTDTVASLGDIAHMKTKTLTIMATRQQDQGLVAKFADVFGLIDAQDRGGRVVPAFGHRTPKKILTAQLNLAGDLQRAASVHGVAAHGLLYETLAQTWRGHEQVIVSKRERRRRPDFEAYEDTNPSNVTQRDMSKPWPPRLCLHSYSGSADTIRHYLHPSVPVVVFFSFSNLVNFASQSKKAVDAIKAVPDDRILAESDFHCAGKRMDHLMEDIVRSICRIRCWSLSHGVEQLASNWRRFVFGFE